MVRGLREYEKVKQKSALIKKEKVFMHVLKNNVKKQVHAFFFFFFFFFSITP